MLVITSDTSRTNHLHYSEKRNVKPNVPSEYIRKPNEDLERAISMEELLKRIKEDM